MDEQMEIEWEAWQALCAQFKKVVGDVNDPKYPLLFSLIREWGEQLALLRRTQTADVSPDQIAKERERFPRT